MNAVPTSAAAAVGLMSLIAGLPCPIVSAQAAEPEPVAEPAAGSVVEPDPVACRAQPVIQLAICLDTSGSMDGLIHQARTRIWSIVNELGRVRHAGRAPELQIAVYQYGSDHHPSSEGFAACVLPFTSDLDAVSEALFGLTIAGSNEYCGSVIRSAATQLGWTATGDASMRLLVIAGNEPFTQGPVPYRSAVPDAVERGIAISTIYCGPDSEGQSTGWLHAAHLGNGDYAVIDQNRRSIDIRCPQDARLGELNAMLNDTYVGYGARGEARAARQRSQDRAMEQADAQELNRRIAAKAGASYDNRSWDLVDLYEDKGRGALGSIERRSLPEAYRGMGDAELEAEVVRLSDRRRSIRDEIRVLAAEREAYMAEALAARGEDAGGMLDAALAASIRRQAEASGFEIAE